MARQTRAQRRARRQEQAETAGGGVAQRARARQAQVRATQPVKAQTGTRRPRVDSGARRFLAESWGELKKVEWPRQSQVVQGTVVVLIACVIVGVYLWGADVAFKRLVQDVLLR